MRGSRLAILFVLLYVAFDFANPLMPGAVSFDPDDSVEAVRASQAGAGDAAVVAVPPRAPERLQAPAGARPLARVASAVRPPRERLGHLWRAPARLAAPPQPSEDH
ncbi:MAG TPA: hypothetical protein DDZ42_03920 [Candidatus Rokubacteria bacterium]|nr:hypothetical protein [Candidatus Rokubacteria bacterium]